mgnify:CR=1 FL=1
MFENSTSTQNQTFSPYGVEISDDGTVMFVIGTGRVHQYDLNTPWDVSTAAFTASTSVTAQDGFLQGLAVNDDASKLYIWGGNNDDVYEYSLSTPWDVTTLQYEQNFDAPEVLSAFDIDFTPDGKVLIIVDTNNEQLFIYDLSVAYDISTAIFRETLSTTGDAGGPTDIRFSPDGKMFLLDTGIDGVIEFDPIGLHEGGFVGSNAMHDVVLMGNMQRFVDAASTTDLLIQDGVTFIAPTSSLSVAGDITNNGTFANNDVSVYLTGAGNTVAGSWTGANRFADVSVLGSYTFSSNASATNLVIDSGASLTAPLQMSVAGDYTNNGTFTSNAGEMLFDAQKWNLDRPKFQTATVLLFFVSLYNIAPRTVMVEAGHSTSSKSTKTLS